MRVRMITAVMVPLSLVLTAATGDGTTPDQGTGEPPEQADRVIVSETTGGSVTVTGEGDCRNLSVEVDTGLLSLTAAHEVTRIEYRITADCRVDDVRFSVLTDPGSVSDTDGMNVTTVSTVTTSPIESAARSSSGSASRTATSSGCGSEYGNYIHSSSTAEDPVLLNIARLRYHTDRKWTRCVTSFKSDRWAEADKWFNWNTIRDYGESWYQSGSSARSRSAKAFLTIDTDFPLCDSFSLYNTNKTYPKAKYRASFTQDDLCWTLHMITDTWSNTNRDG